MPRVLIGVFAWLMLGMSARADDAVEKIVARVAELGGFVTRDEKLPGKPVTMVSLNGPKVTDAVLKEMATLKSLSTLMLMSTAVTPDGLKQSEAFPELRTLHLTGSLATDASLKHVALLPKLRMLTIQSHAVTDDGMLELRALKSLETFEVSGLTDGGLTNLAGC